MFTMLEVLYGEKKRQKKKIAYRQNHHILHVLASGMPPQKKRLLKTCSKFSLVLFPTEDATVLFNLMSSIL